MEGFILTMQRESAEGIVVPQGRRPEEQGAASRTQDSMSDKRQKNQLPLAFTEERRSEAPKSPREGTESFTAKCETESPARAEQLMEEVCERDNCQQALGRVKANKGSPGIDGMRVDELPGYLKQHWPALREQLLSGTYQPKRSAHQAVVQAQQYIAAGNRWVVDLDLEKFFDRVNHDKLMAALARRVKGSMDPSQVASHDLEAMEARQSAVCQPAPTAHRHCPCGPNRRQSPWPMASG
jgi:hypothetical protein